VGIGLATMALAAGCTPDAPVEAPRPRPAARRTPSTEGMVRIPGGTFTMGTRDGFPYEGPPHRVTLRPFWIDVTEVTNRQFMEFVAATGYVTEAERWGWAGIFNLKKGIWEKVDGASWRHPEGPDSSLTGKEDYPVVLVSWNDANAYAEWAGKRLPTEAEWEFAARGGLAGKRYAWGDELRPGGRYLANFWQGIFPQHDDGLDGVRGVGPVKRFPPNGYGLYDMAGNVWEWCWDWFGEYPREPVENPRGPETGTDRVIRGGSYLCAEGVCEGYRVAARQFSAPTSGNSNLGFRCAMDDPPPGR